jgi:SAM-dependent methyltransferase
VAALLRSVSLGPGSRLRILDAPCGTGRLENGLLAFGDVTGLDVSRAMLATDHTHRGAARVCADVRRMPFADGTFDAVVCCRLLHHLPTEDVVASVLAELVRVSRDLVVVSFWDSGSLAAWRRRIWPGARPPRRLARSRDTIAALLERAGARVLEWRHSLRFVSRQTFVLARKRTLP